MNFQLSLGHKKPHARLTDVHSHFIFSLHLLVLFVPLFNGIISLLRHGVGQNLLHVVPCNFFVVIAYINLVV